MQPRNEQILFLAVKMMRCFCPQTLRCGSLRAPTAWSQRTARKARSPAWSPIRTSGSPFTTRTLICPSRGFMSLVRASRPIWSTGPTCVEESWTGRWKTPSPSTSTAFMVRTEEMFRRQSFYKQKCTFLIYSHVCTTNNSVFDITQPWPMKALDSCNYLIMISYMIQFRKSVISIS